jgi:transposase-like protein
MRDTIDMAETISHGWWLDDEKLKAFEALVRADEQEAIKDEWWMCVQSDLENGVKSLNEQAATKWRKEYPEIAKFGAWLNARGNT